MTSADVTIVMPTYRRPDLAEYMVSHISHRPFVVVVNSDRMAEDLPDRLPSDVTVVLCEPGCGPVKASEAGFLSARTRLVLNLNDDMQFTHESEGWLPEVLRVYEDRFGNGEGVVALRDGMQDGAIACFALFARAFYMRHIFPAPYRHYYVDTEMTRKAEALMRYAYAPGAFIRHLNLVKTIPDVCRAESLIFKERMRLFCEKR